MTQLILFRAVQGLGGGGLMVTTQAVVGDIVAPRERGRYQGVFGAVFAARLANNLSGLQAQGAGGEGGQRRAVR
jgi:MFS family permease